MSRINIRHYKKHHPIMVTPFEKKCKALSKMLDEIGEIIYNHVNEMHRALLFAAHETFLNPDFLKTVVDMSKKEMETKYTREKKDEVK